MKVKLLKLLRSKFVFKHNSHYYFADYRFDQINNLTVPCNNSHLKKGIFIGNFKSFIMNHNDYIGLSKNSLKKLKIT